MKAFKKLTLVTLATLSVFGTVTPAFAEEETITADQLFTQEELANFEQSALEGAYTDPVEPDRKNFSRAPMGSWSWRDGVICITDSYAKTPLFNNGHAGIVAVAPHYDKVVEANPADGVQAKYGAWDARFKGNTVWQLGVKRTSVAQDQRAGAWATQQIGKPYNRQFSNINRRDAFYCSHLVWAAYKDTTGVDIGTWEYGAAIHPFELIHSKETQIIFRNR